MQECPAGSQCNDACGRGTPSDGGDVTTDATEHGDGREAGVH
jgi:hypothetical protein